MVHFKLLPSISPSLFDKPNMIPICMMSSPFTVRMKLYFDTKDLMIDSDKWSDGRDDVTRWTKSAHYVKAAALNPSR